MNSQTTLIMFIVMMIITVGGILIMNEVNQNAQQKAAATSSGTSAGTTTSHPDMTLVNTVGTSIQSNTYKYVQMQVRYSGKERLNLNDTTIIVSTDKSQATLQYRNGTTYRDTQNGFYTQ